MGRVLNSLTSPGMVAATLSTLSCGASFAEIGKRDIWSPARVAQERPDVRYQLVAIDFLPLPVLRDSFMRLSNMLDGQDIVAVPALAYPFTAVATALRQLSQARHVGKVVTRTAAATHSAEEQGLWVIADGLQPLGLATATWLASRHGRHHVVLLDTVGRCKSTPAFVTSTVRQAR